MPTENRSSNTESKIQTLAQHPEGRRERFQKWVLATNHPVLGYLDGTWLARGDDREGYADKYVQGLWVAYKEFGQPAPQPHPDPIAWMVGTAFWWTKEEAERDAAETGLPIVGLGPMAGHGEVERCEARLHEVASLCASVEQERDALRAQLAEAHALLARVVNSGALTSEQYESLEAECCAISTSAPKCKTCQDQGEVFVRKSDVHYGMQTEPEPVMAACPDCAEPSALPDPLGCNECTHAECGRFDGPRQVECRAMADNACARPGASS